MGDGRPVGLTKDAGWQIGARRTLPIESRTAWRLLTSTEGLALWLGAVGGVELTKGSRYELSDGTSGEVRAVSASHLRLTWQPADWSRASVLQLRVLPKGERSVIAFHQEHLPSGQAREDRRRFFHQVLDKLERDLDSAG